MTAHLTALAGTPDGATLAALLALMSAFAHAVFGALQKGSHDPWLSRGSIDFFFALTALPVALFLVPWPDAQMALILAGAIVIHFAYKFTMARAYEHAAYTVVYPVVRGTGPVVTVMAAAVVFGEVYTGVQWLGVACLSGGILLLALRNLGEVRVDPRPLRRALAWAILCGGIVAAYTTYDAWGIRVAHDPFSFLAWFFLVSSIDFAIIGWVRYHRMATPPQAVPLLLRGLIGALIGWVSFGGIMLATYLDKVGEAAVLRETSTVFAALIGWLLLGERVGRRKFLLMALIASGAVIVEFGGRL